jgi:hypothetical protein
VDREEHGRSSIEYSEESTTIEALQLTIDELKCTMKK